MAVDIYGNIIDDTGKKLGGRVDLSTGQPITSQSLTQDVPELTLPPQQTPTDFGGTLGTNLDSLLQTFNAPTKEEQTGDELQKMILGSMDVLAGESQRKQTLEQEAGLPEQRKELQSVVNQLQTLNKQYQAVIPQTEAEFRGRGSIGAISGEAGARQREIAVQSLGLAAIGQTLQGNISLAESTIQNALQAEFEPERLKLQTLERIYSFNKEALERVDKKRADNLNIILGERKRILDIQQADKEEIYKIGQTAAKYGADTATVQKIFNSKNRGEALANAGTFLQDPQAKIELEGAKLNNALRRVQIAREQAELDIFKKYGGLTPEQYNKQREEESRRFKDENAAIEQSKVDGMLIKDNIDQLNTIKNSNALDTVVGTNIFARGVARQKGWFSTAVSLVTSPLTSGGIIDEFRTADATVALTQQIIDQQFLDKLIEVKAKGATFGALTDREGQALRNAANAIANTAIVRDDKVIGYDISEKEFKAQLEEIEKYMKIAYEKATGESFTSEEQTILDEMFGSTPSLISGELFYNN